MHYQPPFKIRSKFALNTVLFPRVRTRIRAFLIFYTYLSLFTKTSIRKHIYIVTKIFSSYYIWTVNGYVAIFVTELFVYILVGSGLLPSPLIYTLIYTFITAFATLSLLRRGVLYRLPIDSLHRPLSSSVTGFSCGVPDISSSISSAVRTKHRCGP